MPSASKYEVWALLSLLQVVYMFASLSTAVNILGKFTIVLDACLRHGFAAIVLLTVGLAVLFLLNSLFRLQLKYSSRRVMNGTLKRRSIVLSALKRLVSRAKCQYLIKVCRILLMLSILVLVLACFIAGSSSSTGATVSTNIPPTLFTSVHSSTGVMTTSLVGDTAFSSYGVKCLEKMGCIPGISPVSRTFHRWQFLYALGGASEREQKVYRCVSRALLLILLFIGGIELNPGHTGHRGRPSSPVSGSPDEAVSEEIFKQQDTRDYSTPTESPRETINPTFPLGCGATLCDDSRGGTPGDRVGASPTQHVPADCLGQNTSNMPTHGNTTLSSRLSHGTHLSTRNKAAPTSACGPAGSPSSLSPVKKRGRGDEDVAFHAGTSKEAKKNPRITIFVYVRYSRVIVLIILSIIARSLVYQVVCCVASMMVADFDVDDIAGIEVFYDTFTAFSGNIDGQIALQKLLAKARRGDIIYIANVTRAFRDKSVGVWFFTHCKENGITVVVPDYFRDIHSVYQLLVDGESGNCFAKDSPMSTDQAEEQVLDYLDSAWAKSEQQGIYTAQQAEMQRCLSNPDVFKVYHPVFELITHGGPVVIAARVSSDAQADGQSLHTQIAFIRGMIGRPEAAGDDVTVLATIESGCYDSFFSSPIWQEVFTYKPGTTIVATCINRTSRTQLAIMNLAVQLLFRYGFRLVVLFANLNLEAKLVEDCVRIGVERETPLRESLGSLLPAEKDMTAREIENLNAANAAVQKNIDTEKARDNSPYDFIWPVTPVASESIGDWTVEEEAAARNFVAGFKYDFKGMTAEALIDLKERGMEKFQSINRDYSDDMAQFRSLIEEDIKSVIAAVFNEHQLARVGVSVFGAES